jgi:pSer/pThr/pTyr-binding forkhead associated (FHA) protein
MSILLLIIRFLIIICLYAFIGWIIYTLWIEFYRKPEKAEQSAIKTLIIKYADEIGEHNVVILNPNAIIGRDDNADVQIQDSAVSSKQARLFFRQNQWWIEDLNSTNGTYLNRVRLMQSAVLMDHDILGCGSTQLEINIKEG